MSVKMGGAWRPGAGPVVRAQAVGGDRDGLVQGQAVVLVPAPCHEAALRQTASAWLAEWGLERP